MQNELRLENHEVSDEEFLTLQEREPVTLIFSPEGDGFEYETKKFHCCIKVDGKHAINCPIGTVVQPPIVTTALNREPVKLPIPSAVLWVGL